MYGSPFTYLEEEAEADPLVVLDVSPLLGIHRLVDARVSHIYAYPLPESAGDRVRGVDPAIRVEHVLWYVLGVHAVDGVAHVLPGGDDERERQQAHDREGVVQPEDGAVNVHVADLDEVLEPAEDVQHLGEAKMSPCSSPSTESGRAAGSSPS